MDARVRTLYITFVIASFSWRSGAIGPVIRCEPCDVLARLACKPLPKDCADAVREPGCGCCMTCALSFGQPCGVYTGRCGSGLTCQHQPGETKPLQALLEGRGICANATVKRQIPGPGPIPPVNDLIENMEDPEEGQNVTSPDIQTSHSGHRYTVPLRPPSFVNSAKTEVLSREQQKRTQSFKIEGLPRLFTEKNISQETKKESEYGPCRREMESILNDLKITDSLGPGGFRIPNCDRKGFYKKKQCRSSKGKKRGICWCVDKYGQRLPCFHGNERGNVPHHNSEGQ